MGLGVCSQLLFRLGSVPRTWGGIERDPVTYALPANAADGRRTALLPYGCQQVLHLSVQSEVTVRRPYGQPKAPAGDGTRCVVEGYGVRGAGCPNTLR
jgi:hypothetical protein